MKIPRYINPSRTAENWPRHKAKARLRKATRTTTAQQAQAALDRASDRKL